MSTWLSFGAFGGRYVVLINLIATAMITATGDVYSLLAIFVPMQIFFELGLLISRLFRPRAGLAAVETHPDEP